MSTSRIELYLTLFMLPCDSNFLLYLGTWRRRYLHVCDGHYPVRQQYNISEESNSPSHQNLIECFRFVKFKMKKVFLFKETKHTMDRILFCKFWCFQREVYALFFRNCGRTFQKAFCSIYTAGM